MLAWMLYAVMVSLLLSVGAFLAERAARLKRAWHALDLDHRDHRVAGVADADLLGRFELPDVVRRTRGQQVRGVAPGHIAAACRRPCWIAGSAEPADWRNSRTHPSSNCGSASPVAMLLALIAQRRAPVPAQAANGDTRTVSGASVFVTNDVGPAVVGLMRPRIVVPRWVTMALPSHQAAVIAHEQSHLDARDPQLFTLALALLVFMPWNLPLWWQLRRLRYAIEIDCDARVLKGGVDPAHYGETLIVVGEHQSAYVGAVAAMSESKSFLEERIEHMIRKPVRWRRLGAATLASFAIALTALAAQVSPPNAETPGAGGREQGSRAQGNHARQRDRSIDTSAATSSATPCLFTVKREGKQLQAQLTGQRFLEMYPESETKFFYKVDGRAAGIRAGPGGAAEVRHAVPKWPGRADASHRLGCGATDSGGCSPRRSPSQTPTPGSEAALRRLSDGIASGKPNYDEMGPMLAEAAKNQLPHMQPMYRRSRRAEVRHLPERHRPGHGCVSRHL